jgi:hypothetical protein
MDEPDPEIPDKYRRMWTSEKGDWVLVFTEGGTYPWIVDISGEEPRLWLFSDDDLSSAVKRHMVENGVPVLTLAEMDEAHARRQAGGIEEDLLPASSPCMIRQFRAWIAASEASKASFASRVQLLDPWVPVGDEASRFERQLQRETGLGHILHGVPAVAVARRRDWELVLFELKGVAYPLVELDMSGVGQRDESGEYTVPNLLLDDRDWVENWMIPDHEDPSARGRSGLQ